MNYEQARFNMIEQQIRPCEVLDSQVLSLLAVVKRETRNWRWPVFLFIYTGALAWLCSFLVYQVGQLAGLA